MTKGTTLFALATVLAACGGSGASVDELKSDARSYYWVGDSFEGLDLTHSERYNGRFSTFAYGTCEPPSGEGGCASPLEVQNARCRSGSVNVAIFAAGDGLAARAAKALRPLNDAAREAGNPVVSFDRSLDC